MGGAVEEEDTEVENDDNDDDVGGTVGIDWKERDGEEDATLQNCCARFSAAWRSVPHPSFSTQAVNSSGKFGLGKRQKQYTSGFKHENGKETDAIQKQFTSTTLVQFTLPIALAKQFVTE